MPLDPVASIRARLTALASADRAEKMSSYASTSEDILGVTAPALHATVRQVAAAERTPEETVALALALVAARCQELRQVGYLLLSRDKIALGRLDRATLERLGAGMDNWVSVDTFSCYVAGPAWRTGPVDDGDVLAWAGSPDRWWRRAAVAMTVALNQKTRGGRGDPVRTLAVCEAVAGDRDEMVVKALSWALRALIEHDRAGVEAFLDAHPLPGRVRREVGNKLRTGLKNPG